MLANIINNGLSKMQLPDRTLKLRTQELNLTCDRALWLAMHWAFDKESRKTQSFRKHQEFMNKQMILDILKKGGMNIRQKNSCGEYFSYSKGMIRCQLDGIAIIKKDGNKEIAIVQVEILNTNTLGEIENAFFYPQLQTDLLFAKYRLNVKYTLLVALNSNQEMIYNYVYPDQDYALKVQARALNVLKQKTIPERFDSANIKHSTCKKCEFKNVCYSLKPPEPNCRTCIFGEIKQTGELLCNKNKECRALTEQIQGCKQHIYRPTLTADPIIGLSGGNAPVYKKNNLTYVNGPEGIPSQTIFSWS